VKIKGIFVTIAHFFGSPKAQALERAIEQAAINAEPIVRVIASLVPNRTFQEVVGAYEKYAIPFAITELQYTDPALHPILEGASLRDLAVGVLQKSHKDAASSTLNAAVELAVVASKADTSR
jgi:hypothetical protein